MTKQWFLSLFCYETGSSSSRFNIHSCSMKQFSRRFRYLRSRWWVYGRKIDLYRKYWFYKTFDFSKIGYFDEKSISRDGVWIAGVPRAARTLWDLEKTFGNQEKTENSKIRRWLGASICSFPSRPIVQISGYTRFAKSEYIHSRILRYPDTQMLGYTNRQTSRFLGIWLCGSQADVRLRE